MTSSARRCGPLQLALRCRAAVRAAGLPPITARYEGDVNNEPSVSAELAIEVQALLGCAWNADGDLMLTWTSGRLLEATNVTGPWTTNAAAVSPFIVRPDTAVSQRFYRLQAP